MDANTVANNEAVEAVDVAEIEKDYPSVRQLNAATAVANAIMHGDKATAEAMDALARAKVSQLSLLVDACDGIDGLTVEQFDRAWKPVMTAKFQTVMAEKSVPVKVAMVKSAVLALTNGIKPVEADNSLDAFVRRVRPLLAANGITKARANTPSNAKPKSGSKASKESDNATLFNLDDAMELIASHDDATEKQIEIRLEVLHWIMDGNWAEVVELMRDAR